MKTIRNTLVLLSLFTPLMLQTSAAASGLPIAAPPKTITITAGTGSYDGTAGSVYVRGFDGSSWTAWKNAGSFSPGQSKNVLLYAPADLQALEAWVGSDGARLTLDTNMMDEDVTPAGTWVKNGSKSFTVFTIAASNWCCESYDTPPNSGSGCFESNDLLAPCPSGTLSLGCTDGENYADQNDDNTWEVQCM